MVTPPTVLSHDRGRHEPEDVLSSQRWRLLLATARTIATQGYAAATIEQITRAAGVSKKTFYVFFETKEAAFLACYDALEPALELVLDAARGQSDTVTTTATMVRTYLGTLAAAPALTRLFLFEALAASPTIRDRRTDTLGRFADGVAELLDDLRVRGEPLPHLGRSQLVALLGGVNELCVDHLRHHQPDTLVELAEPIEHFVLRVLGAPER